MLSIGRFELVLPALPTTETGVVPAELNGARLLLVDDSRLARAALGHMLERLPVRFDAAATVEEAIVTLQGADSHHPYQILIVDWQMPGLGDPRMARELHGEGLAHRPRFTSSRPSAAMWSRPMTRSCGPMPCCTNPSPPRR